MKFNPKIKRCPECRLIYSSELEECPICSKYISIKGHKKTNEFAEKVNKKYKIDL